MSEPEALSGNEALALARQGKDAWNAWAAENAGRAVDFSGVDLSVEKDKVVSFAYFTFPGDVQFGEKDIQNADFRGAAFEGNTSFAGAAFKGSVWFDGAAFEGNTSFGRAAFEGNTLFDGAAFKRSASFDRAAFEGDASFSGAAFEGNALFDGAAFKRSASFAGGTFTGPVSLEDCRFQVVPDFRRSQFAKHVTLHGIHVDFRAPGWGDADTYRRLKELAVNARDHDREQFFFACELKAKRGVETRGWAFVPNYLYEWTSDFGRSLGLPTFWLVLTWFLFGLTYGAGYGKAGAGINGLIYSAAHLLPFLPGSRTRFMALETRLFGETVPDSVFALTMIEGVLGIVFLFLIGLALRNRFRI